MFEQASEATLRRIFSSIVVLSYFFIPALHAADYEKVKENTLFNGEKLSEYKLPNGLRVLLLPRHQAKVLTFQIWFNVGSLDEKLDPKLKKTGLAHLFEHMMFRGTEKVPDGKFDDLTSRMGAAGQNASTYFYRTNFFESIPSRQLEKLVVLESDRMQNLKLDHEGFEKEKGAVVGELRRHLDTPAGIANDALVAEVYEVSPFRYNILGTEEEIKGFSLEEAQYFYKTFYAPNNATIVVVGDTTEPELMNLVVKYYGPMKSQKIPKETVPVEPPQKKERIKEVLHPQATSEMLLMAYRSAPVESQDMIPLSLLSAHLTSGMESRLRKILIDKGIAVGAAAFTMNQPDLFEFYVQLAEKHKAEEAIKVIDAEIASLQRKPIGHDAFTRALNQELLGLYSSMGNNSEMAGWLGDYLTVGNDYMRGFEIIEGYKKLTPADLTKVSKKYLVKHNRSIVIVRPQKNAK